jgi:hypothetical protein
MSTGTLPERETKKVTLSFDEETEAALQKMVNQGLAANIAAAAGNLIVVGLVLRDLAQCGYKEVVVQDTVHRKAKELQNLQQFLG